MPDTQITELATQVIQKAITAKMKIATAESCTGGLIGGALTEIAGSSAVFDGGFLTYSNKAKHTLLGVAKQTLVDHGAVSGPVAQAMAEGALANMQGRVDLAIAVTGIAGPGGGSDDKPVGLVWFGLAQKGQPVHAEKHIFEDQGREFVRARTVETALTMLLSRLGASSS